MIRSHLSAWANVTLALAGPALVAVLGAQFEPSPVTLAAHATGLVAIVLISLGVYAWATFGEGYTLRRMGFGQCSWATPLLAIALTAFFVLVFGPIPASERGTTESGAASLKVRFPAVAPHLGRNGST